MYIHDLHSKIWKWRLEKNEGLRLDFLKIF